MQLRRWWRGACGWRALFSLLGPLEGVRMNAVELAAVRADAEQRLEDLRRVAVVLWPDRDDPLVLSELTTVLSGIRAAEAVIGKVRA